MIDVLVLLHVLVMCVMRVLRLCACARACVRVSCADSARAVASARYVRYAHVYDSVYTCM